MTAVASTGPATHSDVGTDRADELTFHAREFDGPRCADRDERLAHCGEQIESDEPFEQRFA